MSRNARVFRINIFPGWVEENGSIGMHIAYVRAEDMDSAGIKVCNISYKVHY